MPAPGHGQDELQCPIARQLQLAEHLQVVQRQQPPIGHHHQALHMRVALQHALQCGLERGALAGVAVEHLVVDRQAIGRLHHAQQELPGNDTFLGHAELAHVIALLAQPLDPDGRQVIEHHRQLLVDERAQQLRHAIVHAGLVIHQRVHAAQQVLVGDRPGIDIGHRHCLQPAQRTELGIGITKPVEHHHADGLFHRGGVARTAEHRVQPIKAQLVPELVQHPDIAQGQRGLELHLGRRGQRGRATLHAQQALQQRIDLAADLIGAAQGGQGALPRAALLIAEGLDQLGVAASTGPRELDEHGLRV